MLKHTRDRVCDDRPIIILNQIIMTSFFKFLFVFTALILSNSEVRSQSAIENVSDTTVSFKVYGACEMCKDRIEEALKLKGIKSANWNVDTKILTLTYEPSRIWLDRIHNRIASVGHDTELKKANNAVYNKLPDCCLYRDAERMEELHEEVVAQTLDTMGGFKANCVTIRIVSLSEE